MIIKKKITRRKPLSDLSHHSIDPLIARLYANRGIKSINEIDYRFKKLPHPNLLSGMQAACELMFEALSAQANILIIGDYDVDGATSTALTKQALESFGFKHVAYFIPDRMTFGYGLSPEVVETVQGLQPDVILTVDNGISSHEGVNLAHDYGMSIVITDHHLPSDTLPDADAIINPNLSFDKFPGKALAGVGVAFYFMLGLRSYLREQNWFLDKQMQEPLMTDYLDLVALGTIADVVKLDFINRLFVRHGLQQIKSGNSRAGINALINISGCENESTSATTLAFQLAPKINAAGRLEDMSIGVECLLAKELTDAVVFAQKLNEINTLRKSEQKKMHEQAFEQLTTQLKTDSSLSSKTAICLYRDSWHPGIVGLIASGLKECFNRPSVVFATDKDKLKGSARSVAGVHIRDILAQIDVLHPTLIDKFGGHAMAAGLTIELSNFQAFSDAFTKEIAVHFKAENNFPEILSDGELKSCLFSIDTARLIRDAGPWATGFEEPKFDNVFEVVNCKIIGKTAEHLRFTLRNENAHNQTIQAVAFFAGRYFDMSDLNIKRIHAAYNLDINRYNDRESLQLIIEYFNVS